MECRIRVKFACTVTYRCRCTVSRSILLFVFDVLLFGLRSTEFSRLSYNLDLNSISSISKLIFLKNRSCTPKGEECLHRLYHSTKENQSNWHEIELHFVKVHRVKFDWFKIKIYLSLRFLRSMTITNVEITIFMHIWTSILY